MSNINPSQELYDTPVIKLPVGVKLIKLHTFNR